MDPRWQHPFTCIVAGPTGCGKTTFVARLLRNASEMIDPPPERVTWYYGEWQAGYKNLDIPNMRMEEGLPQSFDNDGKRGLVVLDDLMAETDDRVTNLFTKKSHHSNTSVIYLVQNLFSKNKESRTISLNSQYMIVFKNPRDVTQMTTLAKQMYPGRVKFVQEAFADATASPYGYLLIDLKHNTPDDMRLRTSILPDDAHQWATYRRCLHCVERCESTIKLCRQCQSVGIENMSGRMKKHALCLQLLIETRNAKLRKAILEHADPEFIRALCECAKNILQGNVKMASDEKSRLRKYRSKLRLLASKRGLSMKQKRRKLQQTGGFLPALLAPLAASVIIPLLRQLFA